jgi:hypothetical protein
LVFSAKGSVSGIAMVETHLKAHWEEVYSAKGATCVSWYQAEPRLSLELIRFAFLAMTRSLPRLRSGAGGFFVGGVVTRARIAQSICHKPI